MCAKPRTTEVAGGGCRNGLMGFFVRVEGGELKRVVWVGKKGDGGTGVCDWEGEEGGDGGDGEGGDGDGEMVE